MKRIILSLGLCLPFLAIGQIPPGYYNTATGSGTALRVALRNIVRPHTQLSYTPGLWNAYYTTDVKPSGKLWDMYSDNPAGTPAYEYTLGSGQCSGGSPTAEGGCYNREHSWPQSKFASDTPMQTDLFLVIPTDYYVNSLRGDLPYGKAGSSIVTNFTNGGKIANNIYAGAPSGNCYEPNDSFKGDIARAYFYIATCYYGADSTSFISWEMANGISFKPWAIQMLLEWHHNDPVSPKEINRNNKAYLLQNNRNPFIDHPEFADCIWGTGTCTTIVNEALTAAPNVTALANAANNSLAVNWQGMQQNEVTAISVMNINGQAVYHAALQGNKEQSLTTNTANWPKGIYIVRVNCLSSTVTIKVLVD